MRRQWLPSVEPWGYYGKKMGPYCMPALVDDNTTGGTVP